MKLDLTLILTYLLTMITPKPSLSNVDLLIIGGGPAGLSAALMFSRLGRPTLVYDSGLYRNQMSPIAHTILGNEGIDPAVYRRKARAEIEQGYDLTKFVNGKITRLVKGSGGFEAEDEAGNKVQAKQVILATGVADVLPSIPGMLFGTSQESKLIIQDSKMPGVAALSIASTATVLRPVINPSASSSPARMPISIP